MRVVLFALALAALALPLEVNAETGAKPVLQIDYSNPGITPSHWIMTLRPDGSGHFQSDRRNVTQPGEQSIEAPNVDRDIQVSAEFAGRVFQTAHRHKLFGEDCESHMKVAFQGLKKLSYSGPDGEGTCVFNYSKDKEIQVLGDSLIAVADTIVEGARLETLLQHDPLGLDKEIDYLTEAVGDGRAQEICTIRPILERLAGDPAVMDRVRKRARVLLARTQG
jgi:hypothetical protein